jgi:hypothetical protein
VIHQVFGRKGHKISNHPAVDALQSHLTVRRPRGPGPDLNELQERLRNLQATYNAVSPAYQLGMLPQIRNLAKRIEELAAEKICPVKT